MSAVRRWRVPPVAVDVLVAVTAAVAGTAREIASPNLDLKYIPAPVWIYVVAQLVAVTHRLNLMVLQAGALRMSTTDADARSAAEDLRIAGCQALAELRDLVGVLRTGEPPPARPDLAGPVVNGEVDLAGLASDSRAVGLPVRLHEDGAPGVAAPAVRRTLFRIVQESLTNIHKHAPGSRATVAVRYGADSIDVTVSNTRPRRPPDRDLAGAGSGSGLDGLRHRVEVVGGTLTAGSTSDGGFTVQATLPVFVPTATRR